MNAANTAVPCSPVQSPFLLRMRQEPKTEKPPRASGGHESRDFCFGTCCSAHQAFIRSGTVASPSPVAGADVNRLTPDACFTVSRSEADIMTAYNRSADERCFNRLRWLFSLLLQRATGAGSSFSLKPPKEGSAPIPRPQSCTSDA
jgi:hypothetical protein